MTADKPYGNHSDEDLTALAARWDELDKVERRALLTEMKLRMARKGGADGKAVIHIRTERRYGRIIRNPDGRVIHIETQVVQVRPLTSDDPLAHEAFGVGFERRIARRVETAPQQSLPADSVAATPDAEGPGPEDGAEVLLPPASPPEVEPRLPLYRVSDPKP